MLRKFVKRIAVFMMAACLLAGSLAQAQQTVQAAQSLDAQVSSIVKKKVKSSDSTKQKLKKLFAYVEKSYGYGRKVGFQAYSGWEKDYALEMIKNKKGSCYHFAAVYAVLAKKATGAGVRIGIGQTNGFSGKLQKHAWVEVQINNQWYICDPNMDKFAANSSKKYFYKKRTSLSKTYNKYSGTKYVSVS